MADVKWIKLTTNMFDNRKIKHLRKLPDGNNIVLLWIMLLTMAGRCNAGGMIFLTENIPYTHKMLADELNFEENTVRLGIEALENLDMICTQNGCFTIAGWEEYQNIDGLNVIREQTRQRVARYRERQKQLELNGETVCQYCGGVATGVDHIIATARGGDDTPANKVPCCKKCNQIKNDKPLVDFLNNNRNRINDDIVTSNALLSRYVYLCNVTNRYKVTLGNDIEEEKDLEFHSFTQHGENKKMEYMGGTLGKGVVLLSEEQENDLLEKLSLDEFNKYVSIVAECELSGKKFKKKSHYQAILDMVAKDRGVSVG